MQIGRARRESYYGAQYIREDDDPMWLACEYGCVEVVKWLAPSWPIDESCLLVAAHRGHVSVCAWILDTRWRVMFDRTDEGDELRKRVAKYMGFCLDGLNRAVDAGIRARGGDPIRQRPRDPMLQWLFDNEYTTSWKIDAGVNSSSLFALITATHEPREYEWEEIRAWHMEQGWLAPTWQRRDVSGNADAKRPNKRYYGGTRCQSSIRIVIKRIQVSGDG